MRASCCHDSILKNGVKRIVGCPGFRLVGGQGESDRAFVLGGFLGLAVNEPNNSGSEFVKLILRECRGVSRVNSLGDEFASDERSPLGWSRECCLDGVHFGGG